MLLVISLTRRKITTKAHAAKIAEVTLIAHALCPKGKRNTRRVMMLYSGKPGSCGTPCTAALARNSPVSPSTTEWEVVKPYTYSQKIKITHSTHGVAF